MLFQKIGVGPEEKKTEDTVVGVPQRERRRVKRLYVLGVFKKKKRKGQRKAKDLKGAKRGVRKRGFFFLFFFDGEIDCPKKGKRLVVSGHRRERVLSVMKRGRQE